MILRMVCVSLVSLGCLALTGASPVTWDQSKCAQECGGGTKYDYSEQTTYIYSYESSNELNAVNTNDLSIHLKANVALNVISKCEMVLRISGVKLHHGTELAASSLSQQLEKHDLPFSFNDGRIEHVCPNPEDSEEVNNVKKAILSSFQNTMRSFDYDDFSSETSILGSCDTEYQSKEKGVEKYEITKTINIPTCSNHLKGHTLFLASFYPSAAHRQHLPFLSDEKAICKQKISKGIIDEVACNETAFFKPLSDYGYVVQSTGKVNIKMLSTEASSTVLYSTPKKENLVFKQQVHPHRNEHAESETRLILQHICQNSKGLISKDVASYVHKLVYTIRQMDSTSVENVYNALKNNEICNTGKKAESIYVDALRIASSGGSIALMSKLVTSGQMSEIDSMLWMILMPFTSYVEEESIASAIPLLEKKFANRPSLLGSSALAFKYCSIYPDCESRKAIRDFSDKLKQLLGDKCHAASTEEQMQVLTALKAFGNLGFMGESAESIFQCSLSPENKMEIRVAAIDAFRRSPCKESTSSRLLDIYTNKAEPDELRVAALISLSRCASRKMVEKVVETYKTETSKQVSVFTWSYLGNLRESSDPIHATLRQYLQRVSIREPLSVDITKFSRHFESSFFSQILNVGHALEGNLIHSADSFLPRSTHLGLKLNLFGQQLDAFQVGGRVEDLEHILEKVFGPVGILSNIELQSLFQIPEHLKRDKRSPDSYQAKIESFSERIGFNRSHVPSGTAFFRILGHELGLLHLNAESLKRVANHRIKDTLKNLASLGDMDGSKNLMFVDLSILFPSLTGRAYKLALNGSLTLGLKAEGKMDLRQPNFPVPQLDIDGKFQPSLLGEVTAAFTLQSDTFQPGVKVETILNAGLDYKAKIQLKDGRFVHVKIERERKKHEILTFKRTLYYLNQRGQIEMPKPDSYNFNYCTKYLQKILGVKYCASATMPHFYSNGKFKIPFVRAMEASIVAEEADPSMEGYEFLLEIPNFKNRQERKFKLLMDTPNSSSDRKFSCEVIVKEPDENSCSVSAKFYSPFYTLDIEADGFNREDELRWNTEVTGDGRRKYALHVNALKVVKGARLVEYQPKIALFLPRQRPMELTGTLVFSKGRKEQLSVNLESTNFASPFIIKGNFAKEGELLGKLNYELNVNAFSQIHRLHGGISYDETGLSIDSGHHYEPDGRSYESVTFNTKIKNIKILDRLSFSIDSEMLFAEHQDLNSMLKWDFSFKPLHHLKSDLIFRYGENFEDDSHLVRMTIASVLNGDFNNFQKLNMENEIGITISCLNFDKSAVLVTSWDFTEPVKLILKAGIKTKKNKEIHFEYSYKHLEEKPLKLESEMTFIYNDYKIKYKDEANEIASKEYQWKSVFEPSEGKQIISDIIYRIKSAGDFHHEIEGTVKFPGMQEPVEQKGSLQFSEKTFHLMSATRILGQLNYDLDIKLERGGKNEIKLNTPDFEGNAVVEGRTVQADFRSKLRDERRILVTGSVTPGDTAGFDLQVQFDADKDPEKVVSIKMSTTKQMDNGIQKHVITGSVNYIGSINVDISGKVSTDLIRGPHSFKAEFSGGMEPMAIEIDHVIKDGSLNSVIRYLRSGVEKLRQDIRGKFFYSSNHVEINGGIFLSSPYKTFDGKLISFSLLGDSNDVIRTLVTEYRIKFSPAFGYEGKFDYERKRGWPGHIKSNLVVTVHTRPLYEGSTSVDYGNGKYSFKTSFTPISKKNIHFLASFEHSGRFAAFHHSLATSLKYLQTAELNAVADLRNMEDYHVHSNMDVNEHKLYNLNSTLKMRSMFDFDGELTLFSKITPSLRIFSKSQASGQISKYDMNLNIDSNSIITASGELKKRKRGFSGEIIFKYKEKEILALTLQQDGKGKHERSYLIRQKFPFATYTTNIKINKEKKGIVEYETKFCRNEALCIEIHTTVKELENGNEYQITYKRGDIEFNIERIRESYRDFERYRTVIFKEEHRYGYDIKLGSEGPAKIASMGLILPSREMVAKAKVEFSVSKPRLELELSTDSGKHPERKLSVDIRFENHLTDSNPSKLDMSIAHPILEKPIEIQLSGDYKPSSAKLFSADLSMDFSKDPDDKIIGKLVLERPNAEGTGTILINIYHKDEDHLDFVIKMNSTSNVNEESFAVVYNWKEDNAEKEAYIVASYPKSEKRFFFAYQRPKLSYRLEGKITSPETVLNDTCTVDLESTYNSHPTKAKLVSNYETGCYYLSILDSEGEISRGVELCVDPRSRKLLSLVSQSLDDEGGHHWTLDYLTQVVQKSWNTIGVRGQINPEFFGKYLFMLTSLADEFEEGGVGSLPFSDSTRYKAFHRSFYSKVINPIHEFIVPEAQQLLKDIKTDMTFLKETVIHYYKALPPLDVVKEKIQTIRRYIRAVAYEIYINIYPYYESYITNILERIDKFRRIATDKCYRNDECKSLVSAYREGGWEGLLKALKTLPGKFLELLENPDSSFRSYFKDVEIRLQELLERLKKNKCVELAAKVIQISYDALEPHIQKFLKEIPGCYRRLKQNLESSDLYKISTGLLKQCISRMRERIESFDSKKVIALAKSYLEDYLITFSPPSTKTYITVNAISGEKFFIDLDIHSNVVNRILGRANTALVALTKKSIRAGRSYSWNTLVIKLRKLIDLNFPSPAQAVIVDHHHFITFDQVFYDFAGECSYLLSRDFEDGNFTLALKPKEGDEEASVVVIKGETSLQINSGQTSVKIGNNRLELPYISKEFSVTRKENVVSVDTKNGLQVKCNIVHDVCTFTLSGWYYGKTAGLLGTYNYEDHDEFKRPKGQIANSVPVFAKSWELKRGCKTTNLVTEEKINKNSDYYKKCKLNFGGDTSPLSACYSEVPPEDYFQLCLRLFAKNVESQKTLCNAAAAYVMQCEKNYVELNLPAECLTCNAPDGSKLEHGSRKKYEKLSKKSSDTIFIVEDNECNKVIVNDLSHLARSIEKELQNEGFRDNLFSVVGFGGHVGHPEVFTAKDQIFFQSRDMNIVTERFKLQRKKTEPSRAFEAIQHAVKHLSRSDSAKSFVLFSCSPCKYDLTSLQYPVVQQILLERGISFHVIHNAAISIRKSANKEKNIIGVDPDTVFHAQDVTQRDLVGEPALRSQAVVPKDLCIALSQDVNGSFFSTAPLSQFSPSDVKNWRSVFARKFLKSTQLYSCLWCDCISTRDHVPQTVCQPCVIPKPRLPFYVGSTNVYSRTAEAFLSYLLHVLEN